MKNLLFFSLGFIAGVAVGRYLEKEKSSKQEDNVEYVTFGDEDTQEDISDTPSQDSFSISDFEDYNTLRVDYSTDQKGVTFPQVDSNPEVVTEDDADYLRDSEDYDVVCWTYFEGDQTFTDENFKVVENPGSIVGNHGVKEVVEGEDIVYVKDDRLKLVYEIATAVDSYKEYTDKNPMLTLPDPELIRVTH